MITTKVQVAKEIRMVTKRIRDRCTSINREADDFGHGKGRGYASSYISEKAQRIKMDAEELHRLNALFAKV